MKNLIDYIFENSNKKQYKQLLKERGDIKFTIWSSNNKIITKLKDNKSYQKIEYKYENDKKGIYIDFLLGFSEDSWKLWVGKIGSVTYSDDYYKSLKTENFYDAVVKSLNIIQEFIKKVKEDPYNYVQYYH